MKKSNLQLFFVFALMLISLSSYIYTSSLASSQVNAPKCKLKHSIEAVDAEAEAENEQSDILPEAELIKKLIRTGKKILPATGSF